MIGKVPPDLLADLVLGRTGAPDDRVLQGPAYGEDTAAIDVGDDVLVVNTDPVSLAADRVGTLAVDVACNDVAASGADPAWLTDVVFLPDDDPDALDAITAELDAAARRRGVAIVGGHSEYAPDRDRPTVVVTCLGLADRYVPTGGARPGDRVILTKGAGIEATAILATDFREDLADAVDPATFEAGASFYDDLSVLPEARVLRDRATAMHDPTEGGLAAGLLELATASGVGLSVRRSSVPVRPATATLCAAAGVDPLRVLGSGALVATVPDGEADAALADLSAAGVDAATIGTVREADDPYLSLDGERIAGEVRDDMYALWEA
jgi:hydrogenase expression/formation protein HypE